MARLVVGMTESNNRNFVAALASQYGGRLRRFLSTRLRNAADVPDLAQEVFLRLLRVDNPVSIRSPEAYLFTVASHVIHQHTMRQSAAPASVDIDAMFNDTEMLSPSDPQQQAHVEQQIEVLQRQLQRLPPRLAATLVLARVGGHTLEEIAEQLGVSRESVKKYLARALECCRQQEFEAE